MSWIPAAVAAGLSFLGGERRNSAQADQAQQANAFSAQQFATRYQTTMADMRAAGLNPMLAYMQGGGSPPSGQQATMFDTISPAVSAYYSSQLADANTNLSNSSAAQADAQQRLIDSTVEKTRQEVINLRTDNDRSKAVIETLREQYQNLVKEGYNLTETGNVLRATVDKLRASVPLINEQTILAQIQQLLESNRAELSAQDVRAGASFGELGKTVGALEPFLRLIWSAFRR